jgi:hypothetical protein
MYMTTSGRKLKRLPQNIKIFDSAGEVNPVRLERGKSGQGIAG